MARITGDVYDPSVCAELPGMFEDGSSIVKVCARKLGIARSTYYAWKDQYPEFKKAASKGEEVAICAQEDVLEKGSRGEISNYNAASQIFIMKCRFRKDYGEDKSDKSPTDTLLDQLVNGKVKIVPNDDK